MHIRTHSQPYNLIVCVCLLCVHAHCLCVYCACACAWCVCLLCMCMLIVCVYCVCACTHHSQPLILLCVFLLYMCMIFFLCFFSFQTIGTHATPTLPQMHVRTQFAGTLIGPIGSKVTVSIRRGNEDSFDVSHPDVPLLLLYTTKLDWQADLIRHAFLLLLCYCCFATAALLLLLCRTFSAASLLLFCFFSAALMTKLDA